MADVIVGTGRVKVLPDMGAFGPQLVSSTKKALAEVDKVAATSGRNLSTGLGRASVIGQAAFAGLGIAAAKFAFSSVASYRDHQEALSALQVTMAKSPALAGATTKAFEDQATALQNLTGFQDEEVLRADTVLARFNLTADAINELTPLVLDYARATGTDATTSAELLGKALLGNARALKTIGINFKPTGDQAKDLASIMGLLEEKVGGAAAAFGKTDAGKIAILGAKFDDLKESVGGLVSQGIEPLLNVASVFFSILDKIPGPLKSGAVAAVAFGGVLVGLGLVVRVVRASLGELGLSAGRAAVAEGELAVATEGAAAAAGTQAVALGAGGLGGALKVLISGSGGLVFGALALGSMAAASYTASQNAKDHAKTVADLTTKLSAGTVTVEGLSAALDHQDIPSWAKASFRSAITEAGTAVHGTTGEVDLLAVAAADAAPALNAMRNAAGLTGTSFRDATSAVAAFIHQSHELSGLGRVPIGGNVPHFQHGGVFHAPKAGGSGIAVLHDNERVIPASGASAGASPASSGGGGDDLARAVRLMLSHTHPVEMDGYRVGRAQRMRALRESGR